MTATLADKVIQKKARAEYDRLLAEGYGGAEAGVMVYEDEAPRDLAGLTGITLVDLEEFDAARP